MMDNDGKQSERADIRQDILPPSRNDIFFIFLDLYRDRDHHDHHQHSVVSASHTSPLSKNRQNLSTTTFEFCSPTKRQMQKLNLLGEDNYSPLIVCEPFSRNALLKSLC